MHFSIVYLQLIQTSTEQPYVSIFWNLGSPYTGQMHTVIMKLIINCEAPDCILHSYVMCCCIMCHCTVLCFFVVVAFVVVVYLFDCFLFWVHILYKCISVKKQTKKIPFFRMCIITFARTNFVPHFLLYKVIASLPVWREGTSTVTQSLFQHIWHVSIVLNEQLKES